MSWKTGNFRRKMSICSAMNTMLSKIIYTPTLNDVPNDKTVGNEAIGEVPRSARIETATPMAIKKIPTRNTETRNSWRIMHDHSSTLQTSMFFFLISQACN